MSVGGVQYEHKYVDPAVQKGKKVKGEQRHLEDLI